MIEKLTALKWLDSKQLENFWHKLARTMKILAYYLTPLVHFTFHDNVSFFILSTVKHVFFLLKELRIQLNKGKQVNITLRPRLTINID